MICKKIKFKNFRNIENAEIEFSPSVTVLNGENGQGKTNILEGIYFCAGGRSFRTVHENELVRFDNDFARIDMTFSDGKRNNNIEFTFNAKTSKRYCKLNDVPLTKLSEIMGKFRAVLFCPQHLSIVKDGPSIRRKFIDAALSQTDSQYLKSLQKYNGILNQRNALIKEARDKRDDKIFLDNEYPWSYQLSEQGQIISQKRQEYIEKLSTKVDYFLSDMTSGREKAEIIYSLAKSKEELLSLLTDNRERELRFGATLYGPHKDDMTMLLNGRDARIYASQGQQRSFALSMKIAEGEISKEISSTYPVYLFDDILSELDEKRREYLISGIKDKQVIITSCDKIETPCRLYSVKNGKVELK